MKKIIISIDGMTCSACSNGLEKYLNKQEGIKEANVNLVMNNASIEYDEKLVSLEDIDRFVKEAGFKSLGKYKLNSEEKYNKKRKILIIFLIILEMCIFCISMSHMFNLPQIPYLGMEDYPENYAVAQLVLVSLALLLGYGIIKNGIKNLIHRTPNMDSLVTIGILVGYIYSFYETIQIINHINVETYVHNLYFESCAMVIFFVEIGRYIEEKNKNKTKEAIQKLVTITPKDAVIIKDGEEKEVTIDEIQKGDIVICRPGQKIAVDGEIIEGETHIDESFITGESIPAKKKEGQKVVAGSINCEGSIRYKAEKIGKESTVSEIVKMVVEATSTKAPIGKFADRICGKFVPEVIIIAIFAAIAWFLITKDVSYAIKVLVSVLVVACPCSLGLATPLAIVVASGEASKKGILVKNAECLENAHKAKRIFLDKTGTLTVGKLTVDKLYNYSDAQDDEILKCVASIEKKSEHPIAKAIVDCAKENKTMVVACKDFKAIAGQGVYGKIKEDEYYIGNAKLVEATIGRQEDTTLDSELVDKINHDEDELTASGNSILYVIKNNIIISLIGVKDIVRKESIELVSKLNEKDIETVMLTGDNEKTAKVIAKEIGINNVISNVSPKEKAEKIKESKFDGITMMCGDGINDSVSLVNADIGIAISNGTDVSIDSAQVVLMNDNLLKILDLIKLSKRTIRIIKQNLFWAFIYNVCMIPVACGLLKPFGIEISPIIGSFAMMMSSIIVVMNSLRIKTSK